MPSSQYYFLVPHPFSGVWVKSMRRLYKEQKLDPEKAMRLSNIGFEWAMKDSSMIKFSATWHNSFLKLKGESV